MTSRTVDDFRWGPKGAHVSRSSAPFSTAVRSAYNSGILDNGRLNAPTAHSVLLLRKGMSHSAVRTAPRRQYAAQSDTSDKWMVRDLTRGAYDSDTWILASKAHGQATG
jgi:hypothetical protein